MEGMEDIEADAASEDEKDKMIQEQLEKSKAGAGGGAQVGIFSVYGSFPK